MLRDFYEEIENGQTVAAALRRAKLHYLDGKNVSASTQSPYFWAGMVAVGSNREINVPAGIFGNWFVWAGLAFLFSLIGLDFVRKRRGLRASRKS